VIRVAILALLASGCVRSPYDSAVTECQRHAPPWLQADCHRAAAPLKEEIHDADKLRALDEAATPSGITDPTAREFAAEIVRRSKAAEDLADYLLNSVPAILAMAEERKRCEAHRNDLADKITEQSIEIGALKAENKRLREALELIATIQDGEQSWYTRDLARRALGKEQS